MIKTEDYRTREDGVKLVKTYSDKGVYILQKETGAQYSEAIDVAPLKYTYEETDKKVEKFEVPDFEAEMKKMQAEAEAQRLEEEKRYQAEMAKYEEERKQAEEKYEAERKKAEEEYKAAMAAERAKLAQE